MWYDRRILKGFKVGDRVILYKSYLSHFVGKLLTKWDGPHTIAQISQLGAIKFEGDINGKPRVVNG